MPRIKNLQFKSYRYKPGKSLDKTINKWLAEEPIEEMLIMSHSMDPEGYVHVCLLYKKASVRPPRVMTV